MYEYTKAEKSMYKEKSNLSKIDARRNLKSSRKETSGYSFNDVRIQRKQACFLPLQTPTSFQEVWGNMESAQKLSSELGAKNVVQLKQDVGCNSNVVQFTVEGITEKEWLENHRLSEKKRDLFSKFFNMVHLQSDFIFFVNELDSYYEQYKDMNYSSINEENLMNFDSFKKYIAMIRDPEGAHGAQRHTHEGGAGNQYIVDRVLNPKEPNKASYLPVDTYLYWDNKLIINHDSIFSAYMELAKELISDLSFYSSQNGNNIDYMKACAEGMEQTEYITIDGGETLTLIASIDARNIVMGEDGIRIGVRASVISNKQVPSLSVTKKDANEKGIHGVKAEQKNPEAHTGALNPVFIVTDGVISNVITADMLKWVTKF